MHTKSHAKSTVFPPVSLHQVAQRHAQNIVQYRKFDTGRTQTSPTIQPIAGRAVGYLCAIIAPHGQNCPFLAFSGFTLHPYTPHRKTRYRRNLRPPSARCPWIHNARTGHPQAGVFTLYGLHGLPVVSQHCGQRKSPRQAPRAVVRL